MSDSSKAMQDALQAAVKRLNSGGSEPQASPPEPFGLLMALLPKLLQDNESDEDVLEKLESLQKEDMGPLREQVQMLRKQCHRLLKSQEELLAEMRELKKQQVAVNQAVLSLARNMERIQLIDDRSAPEEDDADEDFARDAEPPSEREARRRIADPRLRRRVPRNPSRERP